MLEHPKSFRGPIRIQHDFLNINTCLHCLVRVHTLETIFATRWQTGLLIIYHRHTLQQKNRGIRERKTGMSSKWLFII